MKISDLTRPQLIALAIQFKALTSVSKAAALSTAQLSEALNDECFNHLRAVYR